MKILTFNTWADPRNQYERIEKMCRFVTCDVEDDGKNSNSLLDVVAFQELISPWAIALVRRRMSLIFDEASGFPAAWPIFSWWSMMASLLVFSWTRSVWMATVVSGPAILVVFKVGLFLILAQVFAGREVIVSEAFWTAYNFGGTSLFFRKSTWKDVQTVERHQFSGRIRGYPCPSRSWDLKGWAGWWLSTAFIRPNFLVATAVHRTTGDLWTFVNIHLVNGPVKHNRFRLEQVKKALSAVATINLDRTVVIGDFNAVPGSSVCEAMVSEHGFSDVTPPPILQHLSDTGSSEPVMSDSTLNTKDRHRIDHIFVPHGQRAKWTSAIVLANETGKTTASDHNGVIGFIKQQTV
jgi:hypothetical protein